MRFHDNSFCSSAISEEKDRRPFKTARDVPGPFSLPILGTRWIFSWIGYYRMNKIHEAYKGKDFGLCPTNLFADWLFSTIGISLNRERKRLRHLNKILPSFDLLSLSKDISFTSFSIDLSF